MTRFVAEHPLVVTLIVMQVADLITGVCVAVSGSGLSSTVSFRGMTRKLVMWVITAVCYALQRHVPDLPLGDGAVMVYIGVEGLSLLENAALLGVPLPQSLVDTLEKMRKDTAKRGPSSSINAEFVELTSRKVDQHAEHVHQNASVVQSKSNRVIVKKSDSDPQIDSQ